MRMIGHGARFIPLELRRHIAQYCDKATLTQLALVQALWKSECEPVLYARIGLCIGKPSKENDATCACLRTLSTSSRKASMVRALLVWYTPYGTALQDDNAEAYHNSEHATCLFCETIPYLHNLVDLRIRATVGQHSKIMCDGLVRALAGEKRRISLHTLHIPLQYKVHETEVVRILRAQSDTLRLLALLDWFPMYGRCGWSTITRALYEECVIIMIGAKSTQTDYDKLVLHSTEPASILAAVRSLEADPPLPPRTGAPNFNLDSFGVIEFRADEIPDAARMSLLARCFRRCVDLSLTSTINPAALLHPSRIAELVLHFPHITDLFLTAETRKLALEPLDFDIRVSIAQAAVKAGCDALVSIVFPDESSLVRDKGGDVWTVEERDESD